MSLHDNHGCATTDEHPDISEQATSGDFPSELFDDLDEETKSHHDDDELVTQETSPTPISASTKSSSSTSASQHTANEAAQMFVFSAAKAGMKDVDKDHVQKVVFEMSKDSLFFQNSIKQNDKVEARIKDMKAKLATLTTARRETLRRQIDKMVVTMETTRELTRTKVVIDMDMFYAAVEMRDNPKLKEKPLAVGGIGMLSTTNYIARKFGVRAAMPGFIGKELCPDLVIVPPNFEKYTTISAQIREIVAQYDPEYHAMSLDEVYCDITQFMEANWTKYASTAGATMARHHTMESGSEDDEEEDAAHGIDQDEDGHFAHARHEDQGSGGVAGQDHGVTHNPPHAQEPTRLARPPSHNTMPRGYREAIAAAIVNEMRLKMFETTQLTASAGIAANTMLAKICSDFNKPNGQYVLPFTREDVLGFMDTLSVRKIGGIGKVMEKTLGAALDVKVAKQLYDHRIELFHLFSERTATWLLRISLGLQGNSSESHSERKGYSRERTFSARGISDPRWLDKICRELCDRLADDLQEGLHGAKTVTLKLKCVDFSLRTRAVSSSRTLRTGDDFFAYAVELLRKEMPLTLRLMGVRASALVPLDAMGMEGAGAEAQGTRKRQAVMDAFTTPTVASGGDEGSSEDESSRTTRASTLSVVATKRPRRSQKRQLGMQAFATDGDVAVDPFDEFARCADPPNAARKLSDTQSLISRLISKECRGGESGSDSSGFRPCPICDKMINVSNAIAIELHVDACLQRGAARLGGGSGAPPAAAAAGGAGGAGAAAGNRQEQQQQRTMQQYFRR